jgi:hypothetical protein
MNRRGFLLALVAAPAAPLAAKWTKPHPVEWYLPASAGPVRTYQRRRVTRHNPAFAAHYGGVIRESLVQSLSRDIVQMYPGAVVEP